MWAKHGKKATLHWLLNGGRGPHVIGPGPTVDGHGIDPTNEWGHDVLWWLDRMVRSQRPLVEKMTLFWHDHFATSDQQTPLMLRQNKMLRGRALGSFPSLLRAVTTDPAMQLFLSLADSDKGAPNENYARELMELFTLGRGYSEHDIREAARALTGFQSRWSHGGDFQGIRYSRENHDAARQADLPQARQVRLARRGPARHRATPPTRPSSSASSGATSSQGRSTTGRGRSSSASTATTGFRSSRWWARSSRTPSSTRTSTGPTW